jgi:aldose 1-epimerase
MIPSGEQFTLRSGPYQATITGVGASLRELLHNGRDLVLPWAADEIRPHYRGAVLAPWPNRVGGAGRWSWADAEHQLPVNEPSRSAALHGLVLWTHWVESFRAEDTVALRTRLAAQSGYPFSIDLEATYLLREDGLTLSLYATNVGDDPAPFGCSIHPYLCAPAGRVDDWTLQLSASRRLEVDDDMMPVGPPSPVPADADFREPRTVGTVQVDHAYTNVAFVDDAASATVTDAGGTGVRLRFGSGTPWVQVCTSDFPGGERAGLATEPMTCPPDALRSGIDLVVLEPGQTHETWWQLQAVG